tara:strand:- start:84989 stop:87112 length:2124 start_codon:yes stop_codon:yes gene_type:complete
MANESEVSKTLLLVKQVSQPSAAKLGGLSMQQLQLWNGLGLWGKTVAKLEEEYASPALSAELRGLLEHGVIVLEEVPEGLDGKLGKLSVAEKELLATHCDLEMPLKERILLVSRAVESGQLSSLLSLPRHANRQDIKRAYYGLSKELHPDRYHGQELGAFKPVLDKVFTALSQYVKTLSDRRTTMPMKRSSDKGARRGLRYSVRLTVQTKCASWPEPELAVSQDISSGGMFLVSEREAQMGEPVDIVIAAPNGWVSATGKVVSYCGREEALRLGCDAGIGIRFAEDGSSDEAGITALLFHLREQAPRFAPEDPAEAALAQGSQVVRSKDPIIGIDLGTTNTSVAFTIGNRVQMVPWIDGSYSIPSVVAFPEKGKSLVGNAARKRLLRDPRYAIGSGKRLIGRQLSDASIANFVASAGVAHQAGPDGSVLVDFWGELYAMPQICSYLYGAARETASHALGQEVRKAVITVPVCFDDAQRDAMRLAAKLAHLEVVEVIEEPCAAAIANQGQQGFEGIVGVYDFGGGTFDFSLVEATTGDMRVLATTGDSWLGGDDFDIAIANTAADSAYRSQGVDLRTRSVEWQALLNACEQAKRDLSTHEATRMVVPGVLRNAQGSCDMRMQLTRAKVEPLWNEVIARSIHTCMQALTVAGVPKSKLSAIYMSGGTSYIPLIKTQLEAAFGVPIVLGIAPEYAVAAGAGVRAAQLERR